MQPICLPDPSQDYEKLAAVVTGWGRLANGSLPDKLQEVTVTIIQQNICQRIHGASSVTDKMLCAESAGKDSCQGDSGGPLAVQGKDGRFSQIGIVSWGVGCAQPGYPGVYTRLTALLSWLQTNIKLKPTQGSRLETFKI